MAENEYPAEVQEEIKRFKKYKFNLLKIDLVHGEANYDIFTLISRTNAGCDITEICYQDNECVRRASVYLTSDLVDVILDNFDYSSTHKEAK